MHTLVCKTESKWSVFIREHETVPWSVVHTGNVLRPAIEASFAYGFANPWTFSERQSVEVMVDLLDAPEQTLNAAELRAYIEVGVDRSLDVVILMPEGRFADAPGDRWAWLHRPPRHSLRCSGLNSVFRPQTLRQQILEGFFGFDRDEGQWKSFAGGKRGIDKPSHRRELWIRAEWRARLMCPTDFPVFRPGFPQPSPRPLRTEAKQEQA